MSLSDNLVAHYKMNDNAATTVVLNAVGSTHGISFQNTDQIDVAGKVNGALSFDGATDYIDTTQTFQTVFRGAFTISFWVKLDNGRLETGSQFFYGETKGGYSDICELFLGGGISDPEFPVPSTVGLFYYANYPTNPAKLELSADVDTFPSGPLDWTHIVAQVYQNGAKISGKVFINASLYLSGTSASNGAMTGFASDLTFAVGATNDSFGGLFGNVSGAMDNFMIFNKSLNSNEIAFLYNSGSGTEDVSGYTEPEGGIMSDLGEELWSW
jgi:hypothetical protein